MTPAKATRPESAAQEILTMDPAAKVARYLSAAIIHGSPARVRERIARLRQEMYLDYLMLAPLSHGSFMAFTDEVMPHLQ
jgi:alkanesulfonate monooxygenase SsuD/methylene tetrahydromethanopterin reductase-like flavin-dependent oxidoreductase (luciferase family)